MLSGPYIGLISDQHTLSGKGGMGGVAPGDMGGALRGLTGVRAVGRAWPGPAPRPRRALRARRARRAARPRGGGNGILRLRYAACLSLLLPFSSESSSCSWQWKGQSSGKNSFTKK